MNAECVPNSTARGSSTSRPGRSKEPSWPSLGCLRWASTGVSETHPIFELGMNCQKVKRRVFASVTLLTFKNSWAKQEIYNNRPFSKNVFHGPTRYPTKNEVPKNLAAGILELRRKTLFNNLCLKSFIHFVRFLLQSSYFFSGSPFCSVTVI